MEKENPMRQIKVEKIVLNIGCKGDAKVIEKATELLKKITNKNPVVTLAKSSGKTFGLRLKLPTGVKVTLRKKNALELLKKLLTAAKLKSENFDKQGNFSFGIKEYIDIKGEKYNPSIGMLGMDVCVSLSRAGFCIQKKKICSKIGKKHKITKDEAIEYMKKDFGVEII